MVFCSYNIRGLNNKESYVKDCISNNKLGLIALLETHVKQEMASIISSTIDFRFQWLFNYDCHHNGRIWLGWDPNLWKVQKLVTNAQHLSCFINRVGTNDSFFVSFVYALNTDVERRSLWAGLIDFQRSIGSDSSPWIVLGDFNSCLKLEEMEGGRRLFTSVTPRIFPILKIYFL